MSYVLKLGIINFLRGKPEAQIINVSFNLFIFRMSQSTKRKHVTKELLEDNFELPKENQKIVRIVAGRGNNLHQVIEADEKTTYLVSMPNKFRKNVWVKRGNYCIVEPIEEGDKVKAEIVRILYKVCTYYLRFLLVINNMVQILYGLYYKTWSFEASRI